MLKHSYDTETQTALFVLSQRGLWRQTRGYCDRIIGAVNANDARLCWSKGPYLPTWWGQDALKGFRCGLSISEAVPLSLGDLITTVHKLYCVRYYVITITTDIWLQQVEVEEIFTFWCAEKTSDYELLFSKNILMSLCWYLYKWSIILMSVNWKGV